jgi:hypothetical protein
LNEYRNRSNNNSTIKELDLTKSQIGQSGNSDVDVNVNVIVDTSSIAYAYLCSMLATNKMTNEEFESALNKLEELTIRKQKKEEHKKKSSSVENIDHHRQKKRQYFW